MLHPAAGAGAADVRGPAAGPSASAGAPWALYTLTFFVGNLVDEAGVYGTTSTVDVFVDGEPLLTATNDQGEGSTEVTWVRFQHSFVVGGEETVLTFINRDPADDGMNGLDGVRLALAEGGGA